MTTTALARANGRKPTGKQRAAQQRAIGNVARRSTLPEYLEPPEIEALIHAAPHGQARLIMLEQWRAGLRVSEAVALEVSDLQLDGDRPALKVRQGKGRRDRIVPVHPELRAGLHTRIRFRRPSNGRLVSVVKSTAWRWYKTAAKKATETGAIPVGRRVATHTLRHSAARHWLESGVPLNTVSVWLGHRSLQTTLIYLEILGDPTGHMERVM